MERRRPGARAKALEKATMHPKTPMTKEQRAVCAWMKENVPTKKTKFLHSHVVDYFIGRRAVDLLMTESPWAEANNKDAPDNKLVFRSREDVVELLDTLLRYKMFHRAKKIPVVDEKDRKKKKDKSDSEGDKNEAEDSENCRVKSVAHEDTDERNENAEKEDGEGEKEDEGKEKEKKKRRIRLDMHLDQMFLDCTDAYVWLYDPIPWYYWLAGGLIVLIAIGLCLFPLWPRKIRRGAHWLAWLAACFMVGVLCLALLKYIIFAVFYGLSGGKFRFWIFPNLTEDVSFLQSFWPLYGYTYTGEVASAEERDETEAVPVAEDSDSNESGKSGFEIIEKVKDD